MRLEGNREGCSISLAGSALIRHAPGAPAFFAGVGQGESHFHRGNFKVLDRQVTRAPLTLASIDATPDGAVLTLGHADAGEAAAILTLDAKNRQLRVRLRGGLNRFWLRLCNAPGEHVWGGGEQFSHFCLNGRRFPMWVQEAGVGRDMTARSALIAEIEGQAGAHEAATYFPQPTFLSSRHYALHVDSPAYAVLDFTAPMFHEIEVWDDDFGFELFAGAGLPDLVRRLARRFGYGGRLPAWVYNGAILGLKRGAERNLAILEQALRAGVQVSGLWCEDWCGLRHTAFGARLFWDWQWDARRYPGLPEMIRRLGERGIRFLVYANPYLCTDGPLFKEAADLGLLARNPDGAPCTVDFGEFDAGFVNFTGEAGRRWYKERVIKQNMLALGVAGWMADFGEYQPTEMRTAAGEDGWRTHNRWPELWARVNAEAIAEAGRAGDVLFFMRAGYTGAQRHGGLLWSGDQSVNFSRHDGLETAICAALSAGLLGNTACHSDIGGYTTLHGNARTEEVFMRWAEMAAFTPVMRTHEGNRPDESFQFHQSARALAHFARMTRIYRTLAPYLQSLSAEAAATGLPIQRPLALHFEHDRATWTVHDQYLYGPDLLVAPVHAAAVAAWRACLPAGEEWVHLWSGRACAGGQTVEVDAPLGEPPVFYRRGSPWEALFLAARAC
ncbi:alpha-glucosidase [Propionivibrio sp.]|uniref:alpha-glucosidase n=1 Tax=Propionivibrio sp. TaxID=2212460 RepID=UPI0039E57E55